MLVGTPRMRNSASARRARRIAAGSSGPRQVSLTSSESSVSPPGVNQLVVQAKWRVSSPSNSSARSGCEK